jgi:hypothetical protein
MADPEHVPDRQMLAELERQRQSSAKLMNTLATRLAAFASMGTRAAGNAQRAAYYVQSSSPKELVTGLERWIRRRPGSSLLAAAAAGFLIGRALRRR